MKKFKIALAVLLTLVIGLVCLTACGSVTGTYKFSSMKMESGGVSVEIKAGEEYMGVTISEDAVTLELKSDGTFIVSGSMLGETLSQEGTWEQDEEDSSKLTLTVDGVSQTATLDGGTLTMGMDGMSMSFSK